MRFLLTKRFWIRVALGLATLVAIALIANGIIAWRMESQLRARVAAIRAAGDPASIADLAPPSIPDAENAAATIERIEPRLKAFSLEYVAFDQSPLGKELDEMEDRGEPPTKAQIDAIRAILARYPDIVQALADAAKCETYASRLDFSLGSQKLIEQIIHLQDTIRTAARFSSWRMDVLTADGRNEEAVKVGIETYRLAKLYESEPSMVSMLVAIAIRGNVVEHIYDALAAGPVSPAVCAALDQELARLEDPERMIRTLKSERAICAGYDGLFPGQPYPIMAHVFGWMVKSYLIGALDYTDECVRLAGTPWTEVNAKLGPADAPRSTGHGILADLLTPALRASFEANARTLAIARALRIQIALRQFAEKNGREATGLEELTLPADTTADPFSGKPLRLKRTDDSWVIYSVMPNGVDDGGDFRRLKDYGVAPRKLRLEK
ncbi:MAG: hypothetical protein WD669_03485 [Pirellulales bacterium]